MKKAVLFSIIFIHSIYLYAHNAQLSTVALVQGKDSKWHLILSASLTAYQIELKNNIPSLNLDSLNADRFQDLLLKHLRSKIKIVANGDYQGILENGRVILGHQTDINFEVSGMPQKLQLLDFQQLGFETLIDHYCIFKIISLENEPGSFILQKDNKYNVVLKETNHVFMQQTINNSLYSTKTIGIGFFSLLIGFLFFIKFSNGKRHIG